MMDADSFRLKWYTVTSLIQVLRDGGELAIIGRTLVWDEAAFPTETFVEFVWGEDVPNFYDEEGARTLIESWLALDYRVLENV